MMCPNVDDVVPRRIAKLAQAVALAMATWAGAHAAPVDEIDQYIGTLAPTDDEGKVWDNGATWPGAFRPFGMVYWAPDPVDGGNYEYARLGTRGFSLTHLAGGGCSFLGDVPVMPVLGVPSRPPAVRGTTYSAQYRHDRERPGAGTYDVTLDNGIGVRLTAATRAGLGVFAFPAGAPATVLIDLSRNLDYVTDADVAIDGATVTGSVRGISCDREVFHRVFFAMAFDHPPEQSGTADERAVHPGTREAHSPRTSAYLTFAPGAEVRMRVGISYVSVEGAQKNLAAEMPDFDETRARDATRAAWTDALDRVAIAGGDPARRKVFYTALFRAQAFPSTFSDADGRYIGFDDAIHAVAPGHTQYANLSEWDIYRTQIPLLAMLRPEVASDIGQSMVNDADQGGGGMPRWPIANDEASIMNGDPAAAIVASLYAFGARDFGVRSAYAHLLAAADDPSAHLRGYDERPYLDWYLKYGFVPFQRGVRETRAEATLANDNGMAATALEYETADFSLSRLSLALGEAPDAKRLLARAGWWRKSWDPQTRSLRARDASGAFVERSRPDSAYGFAEGSGEQYTLMIPFDVAGLMGALGGEAATEARLDAYFSRHGGWDRANFFIDNEPSFGDPFLWNWTDKPWRAQEVTRQTLDRYFFDRPDGLPGNDDLGAMSSWVVLAELGLYPSIPGVGGLTMVTPGFPDVTMRLGDHGLRIVTEGAGRYVRAVALDGVPVRQWWIEWDGLSRARELRFSLTDAVAEAMRADAPPSYPPSGE